MEEERHICWRYNKRHWKRVYVSYAALSLAPMARM